MTNNNLPGFLPTDLGRILRLSTDCLVLTPSADAARAVLYLEAPAVSHLKTY